jgi:hypothetical protein
MRTICEVHREIYRAVRGRAPRERIYRLLQEAYVMAKKMDAKLRENNEALHRGV